MPPIQKSSSKPTNTQKPGAGSVTAKHPSPHPAAATAAPHPEAHVERGGGKGSKATPSPHVEPPRAYRHPPPPPPVAAAAVVVDPSEPPDYDYTRDRGRKLRLRKEEHCVFSHSSAQNSPLLDLKQWREKLKILRALPKPQQSSSGPTGKESPTKRPKHKPSAHKTRHSKHKKGAHKEQYKNRSREDGSADIPDPEKLVLGEPVEVEDTDMVSFGDILDPHLDPDTRYEKYLEELDKDPDTDRADLESLYLEKGILGRKLKSKNDDGILRHDYEHLMQDDVTTIETESNDVTSSKSGDDDINVAEFVARAPVKKNIEVRSFSTDPIMSVSGQHGRLHKPKVESRLSLNNFKLRLHLAENEATVSSNEDSRSNSPRKSQSVMDTARSVDKDVKLVQYVTKNSFSPRRNNSLQCLGPEVRKEQESLRRGALHLPQSTQNNARPKSTLAATRTTNGDTSKGGGWKIHQGVAVRKELDFERMIPVSVTASLNHRTVNAAFDDLWKVSS